MPDDQQHGPGVPQQVPAQHTQPFGAPAHGWPPPYPPPQQVYSVKKEIEWKTVFGAVGLIITIFSMIFAAGKVMQGYEDFTKHADQRFEAQDQAIREAKSSANAANSTATDVANQVRELNGWLKHLNVTRGNHPRRSDSSDNP